jgi:hypothetical protein
MNTDILVFSEREPFAADDVEVPGQLLHLALAGRRLGEVLGQQTVTARERRKGGRKEGRKGERGERGKMRRER